MSEYPTASCTTRRVRRQRHVGDIPGQLPRETYEGDRVFDVIVKLAPQWQGSITDIANLPLQAPDGAYVPLKRLADIGAGSGLYRVEHQGGRRLQTVTRDVQGRDLASFVRDARERIAAKVTLPRGAYIEFSGTAETQARAQRDLALKALFAGAGIVNLPSVITRNWRNLLLALANLPFAFVGGVAAAFAAGGGVLSLIGFVTLLGITLRNSIVMISRCEHLVEADGISWGMEAAVRGAADRLAPILITSLVTGLGLLPLAVGMNAPGREIEGPMALVILGGLFTSTVLNLLMLPPPLALRYGRFEPASPDADEIV